MLHQDYKTLFNQLSKEFNNSLNIQISKLRIKTKSKELEKILEPSAIVNRLMPFCGDEKEPGFEKRRYHLCKLIEHSLSSLKSPECKNKMIRTVSLLAEDDLFTLTRMVGITEKEFAEGDDPILDLRSKTINDAKSELNEDLLCNQINKQFLTDNFSTVFTKNEANRSPINGATAQEIEVKSEIHLKSFLEYVKLCHRIEEKPFLLDLDFNFLCNDVSHIPTDFFDTPDGIKILNVFRFKNLSKADKLDHLNEFTTLIRSLPKGIVILEGYGEMLSQMPVKYIQNHHEVLLKALNDSDHMMNLLYSPEFFELVRKSHGNDFIKKYITQISLLKELKHYPEKSNYDKQILQEIIKAKFETNEIKDREWLNFLSIIKDETDLHQFSFNLYMGRINSSLEEWLISADTDDQIELFELLESKEKVLNYFALSKSDTLKELPKIKNFIESQKTNALEQLLTRFVFDERDENELNRVKNLFKAPPPELHSPHDEDITNIKAKLDAYQKKYLIVDKKGHAKPTLLTPQRRADAYNQVAPHLKNGNDKLKDTLLSQEFKTNIGVKSYRRPLKLFQALMLWAEKRIQEQNEIKTYWENRAKICAKVKNNDVLLLELLLDIEVLHLLTAQELSMLFTSGNKGLFAEIIVRAYPNIELPIFEWQGKQIKTDFLKQLVPKTDNIADLDSANKVRYEYQISQYIPTASKYPGRSPDDAALNKEQLYQLQDQDIAVGEQILSEDFKNEIIPISIYNISENDATYIKHYKKKSGKEEKYNFEYIAIKYDAPYELDEKKSLDRDNSFQTIYLVPINPAQAILVDQKKELELKQQRNSKLWAYNEFKNKIRFIAESLDLTNTAVIAGICNLDGHHYVPYFIYRDENKKFFILTIDPSYETSPMLEDCFTDIFPGCVYQDAHIVQQVRQRDCGFNSLESIRAIAASLHSPKPILSILEDKMHFDPRGLTVNGEPFKGFDYEREMHYFTQEFIQQGENNRKRWANKFRKKNQVNYGGDIVLEYSYDENVDYQQTNDEMEELVSIISAVMVDAELLEAYHKQYIERLDLPSSEQLKKIKEKLLQTGFNFNDTLEGKPGTEAILAIYKMNYKKDTAIGLWNIFKNSFLHRFVLNKDCTPESLFHEFTQTEKYIEYSKIIPETERDELRKKAIVLAADKIKNEIFKLKLAYIFSYIHENTEVLLKSIEVEPDADLIVNSIIVALKESKETHEDVIVILKNADTLRQLQKYISQEINQLVEKKTDYYFDYLEKNHQLFQYQKLIEQNNINIFQLESMMRDLSEQKELNPKAVYYPLIQKPLSQKYQTKYLKIVYEQLEIYVDSVLNHPDALGHLKKLDSKTQMDLSSKNNDYSGLFEELLNLIKIPLTVNLREETPHGKMVTEMLENKLPILSLNIVKSRYHHYFKSLIKSTTLSELQEFKISDLQTLCQHKELKFSPTENMTDFLTLFQDNYNRDQIKAFEHLKEVEKQVKDYNEMIEYCFEYKLLTPVRISYYQNRSASFAERKKILSHLPLNKFFIEKIELSKNMSLIFIDLANELFHDKRYQKDSVEYGSYSTYVQHLLCRLLNIRQPKILLTAQEKHQLDIQLRHHLQNRNQIISLHDTSNILLEKFERKHTPNTYGRPLTLRMLMECLHYWRLRLPQSERFQSDQGLSPIYFQLVEIVNQIPLTDIDKELSFDSIQRIKQILQIKSDFSMHVKIWSHKHKSAEVLALGALLNSKSLSEIVYPDHKKTSSREPLRWTHINKLRKKIYDIEELPHSTQTLLTDLKLDNITAEEFKWYFPEIRDLQKAIYAIENRHERKKDFVLDYTDIQILKNLLKCYLRIYRAGNPNNTYIVLAALLQANTAEKEISVWQFIISDLLRDASLEGKPFSGSINRSHTRESSNFYQNLVQEAKQICHGDDLEKIIIFIHSAGQLEHSSPYSLYASTIKLINARFKETIFFAREIDQLTHVFKEIAKSTLPIADTIKELHHWTEGLKKSICKKTIIYQKDMLMM